MIPNHKRRIAELQTEETLWQEFLTERQQKLTAKPKKLKQKPFIKHNNVLIAMYFVVVCLAVYYLSIEYNFAISKPMYIILGLICFKIWLRYQSTLVYLLAHVALLICCFWWLKTYLQDTLNIDLLAAMQTAKVWLGE